MIFFNGKIIEVSKNNGKISDLLRELNIFEEHVVILKNGKLVSKRSTFSEEDKIEIFEVSSRG